jgi:hypothetical protein
MSFTSFLSKLATHAVLWGLVAVTYFFKDALALNLAVFVVSLASGLSIAKFFFGGGVSSFDLATSVFGKVLDALFLLSGIGLVITFATNALYVPATLISIALVLRIAAYEKVKAAQNAAGLATNLPSALEAAVAAAQASAKLADAFDAAGKASAKVDVTIDNTAAQLKPNEVAVDPVPAVVEPVAAVVIPEAAPTPAPVVPVTQPALVPTPPLTLEQQVADLAKAFATYVANAEARVAAAV